MDERVEPKSYSLFGVRVDVAKPHQAAMAIVEAAVAHMGIRVVLADLWTLLLAQRDFAVWESLSGADLVLPAGDDAVIRRLTQRRGVPTIEPDRLIQDLLIALETEQKSVVLMAPDSDLSAIGLLLHRIWPTLRVTEIGVPSSEVSEEAGKRLVGEVNAVQPEVLLIGGHSPWQERWAFDQRDMLLAGAIVLFPSLRATLAAVGQRAGIKVSGPHWQRRRMALRRAFDATLAPAAQASVRTLNTLLRVPRETLQPALAQWRFNPVNLRRLSPPRAHEPRGVRVSEWPDTDSLSVASPLARLGPPRHISPSLPALPAPSGQSDLADQPTVALSLSALQATTTQQVTGYVVDAPSNSTPRQSALDGINQELIATGKIRDPNEPTDADAYITDEPPAGAGGMGRGTTPLPQSDALSPTATSEPSDPPPTTLLREPLAPTTKLRLPLAPTTKLPRRAEAFRSSGSPAEGGTADEATASAEPPLVEATVGATGGESPQSAEDAMATKEIAALPAPVVEELATAASLGNTARRVLRRRRRVPPRRRKRYYQERG